MYLSHGTSPYPTFTQGDDPYIHKLDCLIVDVILNTYARTVQSAPGEVLDQLLMAYKKDKRELSNNPARSFVFSSILDWYENGETDVSRVIHNLRTWCSNNDNINQELITSYIDHITARSENSKSDTKSLPIVSIEKHNKQWQPVLHHLPGSLDFTSVHKSGLGKWKFIHAIEHPVSRFIVSITTATPRNLNKGKHCFGNKLVSVTRTGKLTDNFGLESYNSPTDCVDLTDARAFVSRLIKELGFNNAQSLVGWDNIYSLADKVSTRYLQYHTNATAFEDLAFTNSWLGSIKDIHAALEAAEEEEGEEDTEPVDEGDANTEEDSEETTELSDADLDPDPDDSSLSDDSVLDDIDDNIEDTENPDGSSELSEISNAFAEDILYRRRVANYYEHRKASLGPDEAAILKYWIDTVLYVVPPTVTRNLLKLLKIDISGGLEI